MRAPKIGHRSAGRSSVSQGAREGSGAALADRGELAAGDRRGLRRDGRHRHGPRSRLVAARLGATPARRGRAITTRAISGCAAPTSTRSSAACAGSGSYRSRSSRTVVVGGAAAGAVVRDARAAAAHRRSASRTTTARTRTGSRPARRHRLPRQAAVAAGRRSRRVRRAVAGGQPAHRHRARDGPAESRHQPRRSTDGDGVHGAVSDEGGVGEGEVLHRRSIDGPLVDHGRRRRSRRDQLPVENVSDPYTLTVTEENAGRRDRAEHE